MEQKADIYLTAQQICSRYSIVKMTLWRWLKDDAMAFPKPFVIHRRRYFLETEVVEWERRRAASARRAA
ncbi:MAG TPA: DNA-binding protein [Kaistia sp.]|nr:DNA-binding protein [Kaistia sp.]